MLRKRSKGEKRNVFVEIYSATGVERKLLNWKNDSFLFHSNFKAILYHYNNYTIAEI